MKPDTRRRLRRAGRQAAHWAFAPVRALGLSLLITGFSIALLGAVIAWPEVPRDITRRLYP